MAKKTPARWGLLKLFGLAQYEKIEVKRKFSWNSYPLQQEGERLPDCGAGFRCNRADHFGAMHNGSCPWQNTR